MEEKGIGRPATYAATITILTARSYCSKEGKYLVPTELGRHITEYLDQFFHGVINVKFTAYMEQRLDDIAENKDDWHDVVDNFWNGFKGLLSSADASSVTMKAEPIETDEEWNILKIEFSDKKNLEEFRKKYKIESNIEDNIIEIETDDLSKEKKKVLKTIIDNDIDIVSISIKKNTLEDIFIAEVSRNA